MLTVQVFFPMIDVVERTHSVVSVVSLQVKMSVCVEKDEDGAESSRVSPSKDLPSEESEVPEPQ